VVVAALVAVGVSAWVFGRQVVPGQPVASGVVSAVVGSDGVSLDIGGVRVVGPAGVAPVGTVLTASPVRGQPRGEAVDLAQVSGEGIALALGGRQPSAPLTVIMPVSGNPATGAAGVLITVPSGSMPTHLIPATYAADDGTVRAEVGHLSSFWPGFLRFDKLGQFVGDFLSQTTGLTSTRPACAGKPARIPGGGSVSLPGDYSANANPVVWPCLRVENGSAVVTLTANTPLPWRVRAAPNATLDPQSTVDVSKAIVLSGYQTLIKERPYAEGLLIPGTSMTYRFPVSQLPGRIQGQADVGTYLGMALLFGFDLAMSAFGFDTGAIAESAEALSCLGDAVEAADLTPRSPASALADFARAMLGCAGTVAEVIGGLAAPVKVVLAVIGSGIGLVVGGLQGAVATATGIDRFTIPIQPAANPAPATKVVNIVAMNPDGTPATGYTTDNKASTQLEADGCYPSFAAVSADIVSCAPTAAGANVCWVGPDRTALVCGMSPWEKRVLLYTASGPVPTAPPAVNPQPWGLVLADGSRCQIRNGGAWPGRADDYNGAYSCEGPTEYVLANSDRYVDRSRPTWTVKVGELSASNDISAPPKTMPVTTAYFATVA
jgi:hypothetical protein